MKRTLITVLMLACIACQAGDLFCYGAWFTTKAPALMNKDAGEITITLKDYSSAVNGTASIVVRAAEQEGTNVVTHTFTGTWDATTIKWVTFTAQDGFISFNGKFKIFTDNVTGKWTGGGYTGKIQAVVQH